ncbi:MAG: ATPase [Alphaproteobacteria bacterium]|nr:ATPase [Alphaproteobacteria bacterium]MBV9694769.1 ATPase [Alphaproteobacteria bacterium]
MKRFYKQVEVAGGRVLLDGKALKTPKGAEVALPTTALAEAVAQEWRGLGKEIVPASMPLTLLANTAIDGIAARRSEVAAEIAAFAGHDHLCYRAGEPPELARREAQAWDPVLVWAASLHGARLATTTGIASIDQPPESLAALGRAVAALDPFVLAGLHVATTVTGSLVLALALAGGRLTAAEAFRLSRIDEDYQAERWGLDFEAEARAKRLALELDAAARFMDLARSDQAAAHP